MASQMIDDLPAFTDQIRGDVVFSGDDGWDAARQAWNLAVDQQPIAVVLPETAEDVVATVRLAAEQELKIAFNAGGHNAGPISWDDPTILLKTERMRGIEIDPSTGRARVEAGVLAKPLALAAGEHGLAFLSGTSVVHWRQAHRITACWTPSSNRSSSSRSASRRTPRCSPPSGTTPSE